MQSPLISNTGRRWSVAPGTVLLIATTVLTCACDGGTPSRSSDPPASPAAQNAPPPAPTMVPTPAPPRTRATENAANPANPAQADTSAATPTAPATSGTSPGSPATTVASPSSPAATAPSPGTPATAAPSAPAADAPKSETRQWRETWPNGKPKALCPLVRDPKSGKLVKHGLWQSWNEDGSLNKEGHYVYGEQDGEWKFYFPKVSQPIVEVWAMGKKLPSPPPRR